MEQRPRNSTMLSSEDKEPVDLQGESSDTPSVLQVVEPILPLLPTETHPTSSAVVLPLSAGELNSTCCNVDYNTADSSISQSGQVDLRRDILRFIRSPESRLCWHETAHCWTLEGFPYHNNCEDGFPGIQVRGSGKGQLLIVFVCFKVVEPNLQLLPKEHDQESSPILLVTKPFIYLLKLITGFHRVVLIVKKARECYLCYYKIAVIGSSYVHHALHFTEARCW
ncbi:uncharacterized protein LOC131359385 [Hemibagrus wyckioides]|uniref:uncharacterized protein LOC131359385 n=1 Tax=Hemibagrus wyckioides TaxID=337641 RepID=UPI00266D1CC5|nr:uncharacterized protein LOC131359385 [Hemibagrus wyckioides]